MNTDGTATGSELTGQVSPDGNFKGDARLLLFTHGALLAVLAYLLLVYVVRTQGTWMGAPPPISYRVVINLTSFLHHHKLVLTPILLLTLWADARVYRLCCTRYGRDIGRCWFGAGVGLLAAFIIFCLWGIGARVSV